MMKSKKIEIGFFSLILIAIVIFRCQVLLEFGFIYTDSDQSIMWHALMNYSEGKFHEPRFYGQTYNTMLESLFAVPLYKLGIPFYMALPIVTSFLSLFPYLLISFFTFRKKSTFVGLIILSIPLLLPTEYSLITSLSRGFVTGIFVASFGCISLFYTNKQWSFFLLGTASILGYSVSANSVLISMPCLFYLFLVNRKNIAFYIYSGIGLLFGGIIHLWVNSFYIINPEYNLHKYSLSYSFDLLIKSTQHLDVFFNNVTPIFWNQGFGFLVVFILVGVVLIWKRKFKQGYLLLSIPILIIFTLGINKVHDGSNFIFYSFSRMYLALPILIGICLSLIDKLRTTYLYFIIPIFFFTYKITQLKSSITQNISSNNDDVVTVAKVNTIIKECEALNKLCDNNDIELVIILNHPNYDFLNYGCSMCSQDFPKTLRPSYERRTWRLIEDEKIIYNNILFIDDSNELDQKFDFIEKIESKKGKFIVKNIELNTVELLDKMDIKIRKYK